MKITQEDQNVLILENKNLLSIIIGLIFFLTGIVIFFLNIGQKFLIGGFLLLFGGLGIFFWKQIKILFDKSQSQVFIWQRGIFQRKEEKYNFSDIKEVLFKEWEEYQLVRDENSTVPERMVRHNLSLVTNDGKEIVISSGGKGVSRGILTFGSFFAGARPKTKEEEIAEKIASFLNVPLNRGENQSVFSQFTGGNQNPPTSLPPES